MRPWTKTYKDPDPNPNVLDPTCKDSDLDLKIGSIYTRFIWRRRLWRLDNRIPICNPALVPLICALLLRCFVPHLQVKPGLSSYASDPYSAANSLRSLLEAAESDVPTTFHYETPLRLGVIQNTSIGIGIGCSWAKHKYFTQRPSLAQHI